MKHILNAIQFDRQTIEMLCKSTTGLAKKNTDTLKHKIIATLFYEPSTRTRLSFESAVYRLGGHVITTENAREFSSAAKGETLEDSIRVMGGYADVIVLRHFEQGAAERAAAVSSVPIINAGDGGGEHPSQALLDVYTIQKELGKIDGITVAVVGDLKHGRAARSLVTLLTKFDTVSFVFVSPPELAFSEDVKHSVTDVGLSFEETASLEEGLKNADVVYMTRVQKERFTDSAEYEHMKGKYVLTRSLVHSMKKDAIVMHPLPRVDEIALEVDDSPQAKYFAQAKNGVAMRMALLKYVLQ